MKTKMIAISTLLGLAIAITAFAGNPLVSAKTTSPLIQGDPVPGVDVSIEQSPGGITKGPATNRDGISSIMANPGLVVVTFRRGHGVATGRQGGAFLVVGGSTGGGKPAAVTWSKTGEAFKMEMDVKGRGRQKITFKITEK